MKEIICALTIALAALRIAGGQGQPAISLKTITQLLSAHDYADALSQADELLRGEPNNTALWMARGLALRGLSRTEDSLKAFNYVLKLEPKNRTALEGASEAAFSLHDATAKQLIARLLQSDPQNVVANAMAGSLAYEQGDCAASVTYLSIGMPALEGNTSATLQFSKCLVIQGDPNRAIEVLEQLQAHESDPTVSYDLAFALFSAGRYNDAEPLLESLKQRGLGDGDLLDLLAATYGKLDRVQDALDAYREACDKAPKETGYYIDLVNFLMEHSSELAAIKVLDTAIQRIPGSSELLTIRGSIYSFLGDPGKADADFKRAEEADPTSGFGRVGQSLSLRDQGKSSEAEAQLRDELRKRPNDVESKYFLAEILMNSDAASNRGEARRLLESLVKERPNDPNVFLLLSKVYVEGQNAKAALPLLLHARQLDPKSAAILGRLLQVYRALGLRDDAVKIGNELRQIIDENRNAEARRNRFHIAAASQ